MLIKQSGAALLAAAAAWLVSPPAAAQAASTAPASAATPSSPAMPPERADPLDAMASVPPTNYRSALTGYRPNIEQAVGSWKQANDDAGRIGGWRAYAREANADDSPTAAQPKAEKAGAAASTSADVPRAAPAPAASNPDGHGAHGKH